jgi:hypothetical protein
MSLSDDACVNEAVNVGMFNESEQTGYNQQY